MRTVIFLWLQSQTFYKELQASAVEPIASAQRSDQRWADIGCSTGLLTRLAHRLHYHVTGYDLDVVSLKVAKLLSSRLKDIHYIHQDFHTIHNKFDVVSATSLLSVVENKTESLNKLIDLLKNNDATLIIIEPTEKMTVKNVQKTIVDFKTFWLYKGLLLWAKAREGKAVSTEVFENVASIEIQHQYHINDMVRITYIKKN
ncbi:MAG TPA: class I SAM-dependent methyltransferase [Epsilonproteobacteria bacterium]|nr:class I SAM-dependent methyltransferase [Campylobacterota bacterium]